MDKHIQSMGGKATAEKEKEAAKNRIDDYNLHPNLCLNCNEPIIAPYGKKLRETMVKKFCSRSCSAKYSNHYRNSIAGWIGSSKIDILTDEEIVDAYNISTSISEFANKLGCSKTSLYSNNHIVQRIQSLGLDITNIREAKSFADYTKGELFTKYKNWQSARSVIRDNARRTYDDSTKPKHCVICGYPHYEVAHIKAVSDFSDDTPLTIINDINNLAALCPNHHFEYDNGLIKIDF